MSKKFIEIVAEYLSICPYPGYKKKPYFSIRYEENGEIFEGFGTYNPKVLSEYIREYFMEADVVEPKKGWIPCAERLPEDITPVIVTWKNTAPESYYQHIVGKHFTGTACYMNGKWYWYSSTTEDMLAEYGRYDSEEFDEAIECIAWMPLPEPYQSSIEENTDDN